MILKHTSFFAYVYPWKIIPLECPRAMQLCTSCPPSLCPSLLATFQPPLGLPNVPNRVPSRRSFALQRLARDSRVRKVVGTPEVKLNSLLAVSYDARRWFQIIFDFYPYLGKWSNLTCAYFSNGLVQPPSRIVLLAKAPVTIATWRFLQDLQAVDFLHPEG